VVKNIVEFPIGLMPGAGDRFTDRIAEPGHVSDKFSTVSLLRISGVLALAFRILTPLDVGMDFRILTPFGFGLGEHQRLWWQSPTGVLVFLKTKFTSR
jgi:hypothetical protein